MCKINLKGIINIVFLLTIASGVYSLDSELNILTTIKPLHGLVSTITEGTTNAPKLLVPATQSPHDYNLKPIDIKLLDNADLIFWTGTELESFMFNVLNNQQTAKKAISFSTLSGLTLLEIKTSHGSCPNCKDKNDQKIRNIDPHYWLDPHNAIVMVNAIAKTLAQADPDNASIYNKNAAKTKTKLINLNKELSARLTTVKEVPFLVLHNAYQYLQNRYALNYLGAIVVNPGIGISAKRLKSVQAIIDEHQPVCVFSEPQINSQVIKTIKKAASYNLHTATLDPLGVKIPKDPENYFVLMRQLARNIQSCLIQTP